MRRGDLPHVAHDAIPIEVPLHALAPGAAEIYVGLTRETAEDGEGFGLSYVEAAATGLPVVATTAPGFTARQSLVASMRRARSIQ